jgi:glucose-6-phosphate dehydrogenase assembly protein OpcA
MEPGRAVSTLPEIVDVASIETALSRMWRSVSENPEAKQSPVTRICLQNLLAYCVSEKAAEEATEVIQEASKVSPGRFLVIVSDKRSPSAPVTASILPLCRMTGNGSRTCCEQINLMAQGEAAEALPSLLASLQVGNVPTFLWLTDEEALVQCPFAAIQHLVDRCIVDGAKFSDVPAAFVRLSGIVSEYGGRVAFSGLNWPRYAPWRTAISHLFEPPQCRPHLQGIRSLSVSYVSNEGDPRSRAAASLLHIGWLAANLEWTPDWADWSSSERMQLVAKAGGEKIPIALTPRRVPKRSEGGLLEVSFQTEVKGRVGLFVVQRDADGHALTSSSIVEGLALPPAQYRIQDFTRANLLCGQLEDVGRQPAWEAAVHSVARFFAYV